MTAVIAGATGLVGRALIKKLLADRSIVWVISVSRQSTGFKSAKLTEVLLKDLSELPSVQARLKGEIYFTCLGTTIKAAGSQDAFRKVDFTANRDFAQIAKSHGAKSLTLVSASGANSRSRFFYNKVKGETEEALQKMELNSLIVLRPGLLVGERREFRLAEKLATQVLGGLSAVLPTKVKSRLMTPVDNLVERMGDLGKLAPSRLHIVEAADI